MSNQWLECVCQFFRAQSENLESIMQGLGNQNTISDIGTNDQLALPNNGVFAAATPMHFFILMIGVLWAWMFLMGRNRKTDEKPARPAGANNEGPGREGGNGSGPAVS